MNNTEIRTLVIWISGKEANHHTSAAGHCGVMSRAHTPYDQIFNLGPIDWFLFTI